MTEQFEKEFRDVKNELALFQMNTLKRLGELNETISHAVAGVKATSEALKALEARIKILEESRQRQIAFNATVQIKNPAPSTQTSQNISSLWDFFKRK